MVITAVKGDLEMTNNSIFIAQRIDEGGVFFIGAARSRHLASAAALKDAEKMGFIAVEWTESDDDPMVQTGYPRFKDGVLETEIEYIVQPVPYIKG